MLSALNGTLRESPSLAPNLLEALVRNSTDAMLITEARPFSQPGPRIVFANDAICQLTGYTPEELIGATPRLFQGPLTDRSALARIRQALEEYRPITEELVNYRKDGHLYIIQLQLMPVAIVPGEWFSHFIGIQRDVTLQRQAEYTLRAGEERMRRLVENLPIGAVFCHADRVLANRASERITGYYRDELQTREQWFRLLYRENWQSVLRWYEADRLSGFPEPRLVTLFNKRGEPRQVEFAGYGEGESEVWIFRDVTETQRMQRLMTHTERTAHVGGWELPVPSEYVYWSDEVYRLHEVEPEEFIPNVSRAISFYTPESQAIVTNLVQRAIEHGEPFDAELELRTAKGRLIQVRSVGQVDRQDGRTTRVFGSIQDITVFKQALREREQFLANMQQTQKLESLGVMAGGIAHDFNNILAGMLGFAELARSQVAGDTTTATYLDQLIHAGQRAAGLCKQLLAYAGKAQLRMESLNLNHLIEQTVPLLRLSLSKRANLTLCLRPEVPPIEADAGQIHQVLLNLVLNASEALEERDGLITVQTALVTTTEPMVDDVQPTVRWNPGTFVCLEVCDTGGGIDAQTLPRIFEPFFTTKFTGRGLGLASVLGILRGHKGLLKVDSKIGVGSRFRLFFPIRPLGLSHVGLLPEDTDWTGQGHVLVVDDEPMVRYITAEMVRAIGFQVSEAADGAEALALLRTMERMPEVVLLDLTMPRMDGLETFSVLQTFPQPPVVLLMSGYSRRELNERYGERGLAGFVQKPFTFSQLRGALRAALTTPPTTVR
jgi:PAS domain S-box-containing protein